MLVKWISSSPKTTQVADPPPPTSKWKICVLKPGDPKMQVSPKTEGVGGFPIQRFWGCRGTPKSEKKRTNTTPAVCFLCSRRCWPCKRSTRKDLPRSRCRIQDSAAANLAAHRRDASMLFEAPILRLALHHSFALFLEDTCCPGPLCLEKHRYWYGWF